MTLSCIGHETLSMLADSRGDPLCAGETSCAGPAEESPAPDTGSPSAAALCVRASTLRMVQGRKLSKRAMALDNAPSPTIDGGLNGRMLDEVNQQMLKHEEAQKQKAKSQRPLTVEEARVTPDQQLPCHSDIIKQIQLLELRHGIKYVPENQPAQSLSSSRSASTTGRIQTDHEGNAYSWLRFHQAKLANLKSSPLN
jgi:hypothetical protein